MKKNKGAKLKMPKEIDWIQKQLKNIPKPPEHIIRISEKKEPTGNLAERLGTPDQRIAESNREAMNEIYQNFQKEKLESEKSNKKHRNISYAFTSIAIVISIISLISKDKDIRQIDSNKENIEVSTKEFLKLKLLLKNQGQNIENNEAYGRYLKSQIVELKDSLRVLKNGK